ncbi:MAG: GNAT family N-acetyltransferase, partial [Microbispora sp.]|nr:GNAT family N-acetyltransferase [Microbispora sp.]
MRSPRRRLAVLSPPRTGTSRCPPPARRDPAARPPARPPTARSARHSLVLSYFQEYGCRIVSRRVHGLPPRPRPGAGTTPPEATWAPAPTIGRVFTPPYPITTPRLILRPFTEAARELLRIGFEGLGLHRIHGNCDARNTASARLMERLGMRLEAHLVENEFFAGAWSDELSRSILPGAPPGARRHRGSASPRTAEPGCGAPARNRRSGPPARLRPSRPAPAAGLSA